MKKLKWIVTGLVALLVAVAVAGYVVLSTMDFDYLRPRIEAEAKKATGRDLKIAGQIRVQPSLTPTLAIDRVSFANAPWGSSPEMVTLERFEVEVALMPLLSGDIDIRRLVVVKPKILLETNAEGQANWSLEGVAETAEDPSLTAGHLPDEPQPAADLASTLPPSDPVQPSPREHDQTEPQHA